MRTYETIYVIHPDAEEAAVEALTAEVGALITEDGGTVEKLDVWGKRRLAYEVKGHREGIYVLMRFNCGPEFPKKLESSFKLNEQIIRYLTVHFDSKTLRLEEEQVRRNEAALESRNATGPRSRGDDDDDRVPSPRVSAEA